MTIDERLEHLTERHIALTQTVEIIASMQLAGEKQMEELKAQVSALTEAQKAMFVAQKAMFVAQKEMSEAQKDLTVTMNRLANIVIRHEERLDQIDGGQ